MSSSTRDADAPVVVTLSDLIGDTSHLRCEIRDVPSRGLSVRTWRYSNTGNATTSTKPPVIAIHGGPAATHQYLLPLQLLCDHGYDVIFYDQGMCFHSQLIVAHLVSLYPAHWHQPLSALSFS